LTRLSSAKKNVDIISNITHKSIEVVSKPFLKHEGLADDGMASWLKMAYILLCRMGFFGYRAPYLLNSRAKETRIEIDERIFSMYTGG